MKTILDNKDFLNAIHFINTCDVCKYGEKPNTIPLNLKGWYSEFGYQITEHFGYLLSHLRAIRELFKIFGCSETEANIFYAKHYKGTERKLTYLEPNLN